MAADFELLRLRLEAHFGEMGPLRTHNLWKTDRELAQVRLQCPSAMPDQDAHSVPINMDWRWTGGGLQAIHSHGGPLAVSKRLGWETDYRPRAQQLTLDGVREAFDGFAAAQGLPVGSLAGEAALLHAGRRDLIKEAKNWGGLEALAELFEYEVRVNVRCITRPSQFAKKFKALSISSLKLSQHATAAILSVVEENIGTTRHLQTPFLDIHYLLHCLRVRNLCGVAGGAQGAADDCRAGCIDR